jgi:hypothetical protein
MKAACYAATPSGASHTGALEPAWSASRAQSPALKIVEVRPGESPEAKKVFATVTKLRREMVQPTTVSDQAKKDFRMLLARIDADPLEDGVSHPAELPLATFAEDHGLACLLDVTLYWLPPIGDGRTAALLRLLGRNQKLTTTAARLALLRFGLASSSVEVRDAAAQAAELWEDPAARALLRAHKEVVPWLANYIESVAADLAG